MVWSDSAIPTFRRPCEFEVWVTSLSIFQTEILALNPGLFGRCVCFYKQQTHHLSSKHISCRYRAGTQVELWGMWTIMGFAADVPDG